jgi:uncharacterized membrane protein
MKDVLVRLTTLVQKYSLVDFLAFLTCLLFILAGSFVSVHRFWQYDVFFYDFGIFDQAIWKVSRFQAPIIEHFVVGGKWIWADHFNPSIFLLSPLYWLTDRQEIILVAQAISVGLSGLVLYGIGKEVLKKSFASFGLMLAYFLFVGLQNAVIADFHESTVATLPFMLMILLFLKKKWIAYFISLVIFLGFKETNFLVSIALSISLLIVNKSNWTVIFATILVSVIWGILALKVIIPFFSNGIYQYSVPVTANPIILGNALVNNDLKRSTILYTFWSFGFLPLLSPGFWILMLQDFLARFYPPFLTISWGLGLHYSAMTAAIMGVSGVFGAKALQRFIKNQRVLFILFVMVILNALFVYRVVLRGPFALSYNPAFYSHSKDFEFLNEMIEKVPKDVEVMTQNNLAVRFTHQPMHLLRTKCKNCSLEYYQMKLPEYVVIDARSGQNPNNFYGVEDMSKILTVITKDKDYNTVYRKGDQWVFKRIKQ